MKKILHYALLAFSAFSISGCIWDETIENYLTLHVCEARNEIGVSRERVKMPETGVEFIVQKEAFMTMGDLDSVDVAEVYDPSSGTTIRGFVLNCNGKGKKALPRNV